MSDLAEPLLIDFSPVALTSRQLLPKYQVKLFTELFWTDALLVAGLKALH